MRTPPRVGTGWRHAAGVAVAASVVLGAVPAAATPIGPVAGPSSAAPTADGACGAPDVTLHGPATLAGWQPVTPARWELTDGTLAMQAAGTPRSGPLRPYEHAVLTRGPRLGAVQLRADVRITTPTRVRDRDVVLLLGYRSDVRYAYVHLAQDAASSNHNGIFLVDGADRVRIDDQGAGGAPPAISDTAWHAVEVSHCPATGRIEVRLDGSETPLLTATDRRVGAGRVGFGSFDNVGQLRALQVTGTAVPAAPDRSGIDDRFDDDRGSPHEPAINTAAHHGLVRGFEDGSYRPGEDVRRGQFATVTAHLSEAAGGVLPGETGRFADLAGSPHEVPAERLAAAGVVDGFRDGRFGTSERITRAQAASLVDRAVTRLLHRPLPAGAARFDDVDGVHADAIHRLAAAGIVEGTGPSTFSPGRTLTRGQAASLVVRAWEAVVATR